MGGVGVCEFTLFGVKMKIATSILSSDSDLVGMHAHIALHIWCPLLIFSFKFPWLAIGVGQQKYYV